MNIFEALRQSHDVQRGLADELVQTRGDTPERKALFDSLKQELASHAVAEERHFYIPLMAEDLGVDLSRHAIAEHHEMDEMVEDLEGAEPSSPAWLPLAKKLAHKVHHHLKEEERKFFQMAGKILTDSQKASLGTAYLKEYEADKAKSA